MNHLGTTPPPPANAPGQVRISHRRARHAALRTAMLRALGAELRLRDLTARDGDEPVIGLIDAWAATLSVVGFYHDRVANEGFVGTAVERRSVLELARAIGYELRPGVAATSWLGFTVSAPPGAPDLLPIPVGTRVQTVPGPDETPQVFETTEAIESRPACNAVPVRATADRLPQDGDTTVRLLGTDLVLAPGDPLLIVGADPSPWFDLRRVHDQDVVQDVPTSASDLSPIIPAHTIVTLDSPIASQPLPAAAADGMAGVEVHVLRQRAALFGFNAQPWDALPVSLRVGEIDPGSLIAAFTGPAARALMIGTKEVAAKSGTSDLLPGAYAGRSISWADAALPDGTTTIHLDQSYPAVVASSWLVLERDGAVAVCRVGSVAEVPHTDFGLSGKVTRVGLVGDDAGGFSPKNATISIVSEQLTPAPWPITTPVGAATVVPDEQGTVVAGRDRIVLARVVTSLPVGRTIVVRGTDVSGAPASEVAEIAAVTTGPDRTTINLAADLTQQYTPAGTFVHGNVAKATHGESRAEALGSGDNTIRFQRFTLRQAPLTHVTAASDDGTASTLAVWVDGVRWTEVGTFHGQDADARIYTTRLADDGTVTVTFGDGLTGRRLPTGTNNVVATYRIGIGSDAVFGEDRLTLPMSRPLGLDSVTNPVPASGAADPEALDDARTNAPRSVRALGRIVSIDDYSDFARTFAGVGKARGDVLWDGARRIIHLTIAGQDGASLPPTSAIPSDLRDAIDRVRHSSIQVVVAPHLPQTFVVDLRLVAAPDRRYDDVATTLIAALLDRFSVAKRRLAQPVAASEVIAAAHDVPGVEAVVLTALHRSDAPPERAEAVLSSAAQFIGGDTVAAELLSIDPGALTVEEAR